MPRRRSAGLADPGVVSPGWTGRSRPPMRAGSPRRQPVWPGRRRGSRPVRPRRPSRRRWPGKYSCPPAVAVGHRGVIALPARAGQRDSARLDLAEAHPQRAVGHRAVGAAEPPRLGERTKRRLPQQHRRGPTVRGGPWMASIMVMPRVGHPGGTARRCPSTRGVRWLMWVVRTPAMSAATADTAAQLVVPRLVDRLAGQRERRQRRAARSRRPRSARAPPSAAMRRAWAISAGVEQLPRWATKPVAPGSRRSAEKNRGSVGGQHRGEHPERVARPARLTSMGRNAVDTTGTGEAASRRS